VVTVVLVSNSILNPVNLSLHL